MGESATRGWLGCGVHGARVEIEKVRSRADLVVYDKKSDNTEAHLMLRTHSHSMSPTEAPSMSPTEAHSMNPSQVHSMLPTLAQ